MSCARHCSRRTTLLRIHWQALVQLGLAIVYRVARIRTELPRDRAALRQDDRQILEQAVASMVVCTPVLDMALIKLVNQHNQEWGPGTVACPVRFFMPHKFDSSTIIFSPDARDGHANAPRLSQTHTGCEDIGTSENGAGQACDVSKLPLVLCG